MNTAATSEKTQADIPFGIIEYTADFKRPILEAWAVPALLVSAALDALGTFGFKLDGVEAKTHTEKLSDSALVFRRNPPGLVLTVGINKLSIMAENFDWTEADQFIAAARAALNSIVDSSRAEIHSQHVALGMHIQIKTKPRHEVTAPLLSALALKLLDGEMKFPGVILQRGNATIVIDGSLAYANGLFVKINREHRAEVSLEKMAEVLRSDEDRLFETLGLEGVR